MAQKKKSDNLIRWTSGQETAITDGSNRILVAASAGSGKTSVMIQRAAALIEAGAGLKDMLIVTFTVNAAAEMKTRLYRLLEEKRTGVRREDLNLADIGTLHSFCKKLITRFFYKLDIDPGFVIANASETGAFRSEAADGVIGHFLGAGDAVFSEMADYLSKGRRDEALKGAVTAIYDYSHNSAEPEKWLAAADNFIKASDAGSDAALAAYAAKLAEAAALFSEKYDAVKRKEARLDFIDLERYALELMKDPEVMAFVSQKYKYIFVDEYQDINPKQEEIIRAASQGGSLFMVGDAKQSIYGFRSCDPKIFSDKMRDAAHHKIILLNDNFRSRPEILKYCDDIFSRLMTEETCGIDYAGGSIFNAGAVYDDVSGFPAVSCRFVTGGGAEEEARLIAAAIADLLKEKIYFPKEGLSRRIEYGDIAILTPVIRGAYPRAVIKALTAAGVPVKSEVSRDLFALPEVSLLIDFLAIIDNPLQDIPLAAVMRSSFFRFTDNELACIRLSAPSAGYFHECVFGGRGANISGGLKSKLTAFTAELDRLKKLSGAVTAAQLLESICAGYDYMGDIMAGDLGEETAAGIETFIDIVRNDPLCLTLGGFIAAANALSEAGESEPAPPAGANVRVSTIHHAKGMEFPVVIMMAAGLKFTDKNIRRDIIADRDMGIAVKPQSEDERATRSAAFYQIAKKRFAEECREKMRLLYVALTRAKNHLIITASGAGEGGPCAGAGPDSINGEEAAGPEDSGSAAENENPALVGKSFLYWLENIRSSRCEYRYYSAEECIRPGEGACRAVPAAADPLFIQAYSAAPDKIYPFAAAAAAPAKTTATRLNAEAQRGQEQLFSDEYAGEDRLTAGHAGGGREAGIAYHALFKHINLAAVTNNEIKAEIAALVRDGKLAADAAALINADKVSAVMRSALMDRARKADRVWREQDFLYTLKENGAETLVQGTIDLMFTENGGLVIADYKLSSRPAGTVAGYYRKQLEIYAAAASSILKLEVREKAVILINGGEALAL